MTDACIDERVRNVGREVDGTEYRRLMGLPPRGPVSVAILEGMDAAIDWFERHARPWTRVRTLPARAMMDDRVLLQDGTRLHAPSLGRRFSEARVDAVSCAAVSAGPEAGARARWLWDHDRLDESFALERFAAAVTEHLVRRVATGLCESAGRAARFIMDPASPGCGDWDLGGQENLLATIDDGRAFPGPFSLLASGALRPAASQLVLFGHSAEPGARFRSEVSCAGCGLPACAYRRPGSVSLTEALSA